MLHFLIFFAFYAAEMFTPRMLIELRGASSSVTGLAFICCALAWIGGAITNHSEFSGGSLDEALAIIWVMAGIACLLGIAIVLARFKSPKTF